MVSTGWSFWFRTSKSSAFALSIDLRPPSQDVNCYQRLICDHDGPGASAERAACKAASLMSNEGCLALRRSCN